MPHKAQSANQDRDGDEMSKVQIKNRFTGKVLFDGESGMNMRQTLEKATAAKTNLIEADLIGADLSWADLRGADLRGADLRGVNLRVADLRGANLRGADLRGADLSWADLIGADLRGADLRGVNLRVADLRVADLRGGKLVGDRPFFSIGPIGSRSDYIQAWITDSGLMIRTGCFYGTKEEFESKLKDAHGANAHGEEYRAALVLIDKHVELWDQASDDDVKEVTK